MYQIFEDHSVLWAVDDIDKPLRYCKDQLQCELVDCEIESIKERALVEEYDDGKLVSISVKDDDSREAREWAFIEELREKYGSDDYARAAICDYLCGECEECCNCKYNHFRAAEDDE